MYNDAELQKAYATLFDFGDIPTVALTLTFKPNLGKKKLSKKIAEAAIRHYLRRLNRMRGNGRKRAAKMPLQTLVVLERTIGSDREHLHYHLQVEVPPTYVPKEFADHCLLVWSKLRWGGLEEACVAKINADSGWTDYCLKLRTKQDYNDSIDVMNSYISPRDEEPTAFVVGVQ